MNHFSDTIGHKAPIYLVVKRVMFYILGYITKSICYICMLHALTVYVGFLSYLAYLYLAQIIYGSCQMSGMTKCSSGDLHFIYILFFFTYYYSSYY